MGAFEGGSGSDAPLGDGTAYEISGGAPLGFPLPLYKRSCPAVGRRNHTHNKAFKRAEGIRGIRGEGREFFCNF